jgi:hypothetical protein
MWEWTQQKLTKSGPGKCNQSDNASYDKQNGGLLSNEDQATNEKGHTQGHDTVAKDAH